MAFPTWNISPFTQESCQTCRNIYHLFVNTEPMLEYMLRVSLFLSEQNMNCLLTGSTKKTSLATENDHSVSLSLWLESILPESSRFYFYHSTINPFSYSPKQWWCRQPVSKLSPNMSCKSALKEQMVSSLTCSSAQRALRVVRQIYHAIFHVSSLNLERSPTYIADFIVHVHLPSMEESV